MSTDLSRKKRVRAGHQSSATKMVRRAEELLSKDAPDVSTLSRLKLTLNEKLEILRQLDGEILDVVEEEAVVGEIDQSDEFKDDVYATLMKIERHIAPDTSPPYHLLEAQRGPNDLHQTEAIVE